MPIVISANFNVGNSFRSLQKLQDQLDRTTAKVRALNAEMGQIGNGSLGGRMATYGGSSASARRASLRPSSPMFSSSLSRTAPRVGGTSGNGLLTSASRFAAKAPTQGNVGGALQSSLGAIGNLSGLLGELTNPVGLAIAAMSAFAAMVTSTAGVFDGWRRSLVRGGGSLSQSRGADLLGGVLGSDLSGVGRGLMGGYGPIAAGMAGVSPFGGPFGDRRYARKGIAVARLVNRARSFDQAQQIAETANDPGLANAYFLKRNTFERLANRPGASFQNLQRGAEFGASVERFKDAASTNLASLSGPSLDLATKVLNAMAEAMEKWAPVIKLFSKFSGMFTGKLGKIAEVGIDFALKILDKVTAALMAFGQALQFVLEHLPRGIQRAIGYTPDSERDQATKDNTKALNDNTAAQREGMYGGGPRAAGAVPSSLRPLSPHQEAAARNAAYGII